MEGVRHTWLEEIGVDVAVGYPVATEGGVKGDFCLKVIQALRFHAVVALFTEVDKSGSSVDAWAQKVKIYNGIESPDIESRQRLHSMLEYDKGKLVACFMNTSWLGEIEGSSTKVASAYGNKVTYAKVNLARPQGVSPSEYQVAVYRP